MSNFCENEAMNYQNKHISRAGKVVFLLSLIAVIMVLNGSAAAKSLYVLSNINAYPQPVQAYNIGTNGTLTFQNQFYIPKYNLGGMGLAMDSDSGYLFVTNQWFDKITLVNSKTTVTVPEMVEAPNSWNLSGIVYDHTKGKLYCVDSGRNFLWVYNWNSKTVSLTLDDEAPFVLRNASAYGIALDEIKQLLYVANSTNKIYAYSTVDWSLNRTITLNRTAVCVAVDVKNNTLYTGGGFVGNPYLTQYKLSANTQLDTLVESGTSIPGAMGIAVDPNSSDVYVTTGNGGYLPSGGNIRIYDKLLHPIDSVHINGSPTALVIPGREIGYNPLGLTKTILKVTHSDGTKSNTVNAGDIVTYRISFSNKENDFTVQDVYVEDDLPAEVTFVSASDNDKFGEYDPDSHTYSWLYPSLVTGSTANLDITVKINDNVSPRTTITNSVTVTSNSTPQTTTNAEIITASNPLNVKKTVFGTIEGQTFWVDPNEVITYNIHVDNNDNIFSVNDVIITDTLSDNLVYVKADKENASGVYDSDLNKFTWTIPSLASKASVDLGITVRLKDNVPDGTIITNTVTAQSSETIPSSSNVDIRVGQGPLMVSSVQIIPNSIRRDSRISGFRVTLEMPQGYKVNDIKNTPLLLSLVDDPSGATISANNGQIVTQALGKTYIVAVFSRKRFMDITDGYGPKEVMIQGTLTNGSLFAGFSTINITKYAGY